MSPHQGPFPSCLPVEALRLGFGTDRDLDMAPSTVYHNRPLAVGPVCMSSGHGCAVLSIARSRRRFQGPPKKMPALKRDGCLSLLAPAKGVALFLDCQSHNL